MDPISITAATSSLVFTVVKNGRALASVYEKYQDAQRCLFLMQTECTVLAAALSQIQVLFLDTTSVDRKGLKQYPEDVLEALDLSLVGCNLTLSVLTKEIERLADGGDNDDASRGVLGMRRGKRVAYVWKEESMNELLQQLRGQSAALTLLLKAFDSSSIEQILRVVQSDSGRQAFQRVKRGAASIRSEYPTEKYAESILDMVLDDTKTIYSLDLAESETSEGETLVSLSPSPVSANPSSALSLPFETTVPKGWTEEYSSQCKAWFYVNTSTGKSQWDHPGHPTAARQMTIRSKSPINPFRKPISPPPNTIHVTPSPRPSATASKAKFSNNPFRKPISPPPNTIHVTPSARPLATAFQMTNHATSNEAAEDLDFMPWAMNTDTKLHNALDRLRVDSSAAALAVGIISAEREPRIHVIGARKRDCPIPVTRADRFTITQAEHVAVTVMAILVDRGVFSWDETVLTLFPRLARRFHILHHQTTLAMLGAQQSGLTTPHLKAEGGDLSSYCYTVSGREGRSATALSCLGRPPDETPGTKCTYHSVNTLLMVLAIEERTSKPIDILAKALIFDPLEMYSTSYGRTPNADVEKPTQPWGHFGATNVPKNPSQARLFTPPALDPVDGLHSSIPDYAAFVKLHLRGAMGLSSTTAAGAPILTPAAFKTLHSCVGGVGNWTVGSWVLSPMDGAGGRLISMYKAVNGFSMEIQIAPVKGVACFVVANVDAERGKGLVSVAATLAMRFDQG